LSTNQPNGPSFEAAFIEQDTAPTESSAGEVRVFAKRFWGGRQAEFTAALDRLLQLRPRLESILDMEGVSKQLVAVMLNRERRSRWLCHCARLRGFGNLFQRPRGDMG
jgi:hypothetical protein